MVLATAPMDELFAAVPTGYALDDALPDGVEIAFELSGRGGGTWTLYRQDERTAVGRRSKARPDCHVSCSVEDFRALLTGELEMRKAFLEGRVQMRGDVGLAITLLRAIRTPLR